MTTTGYTSKGYLKALTILYIALLLGQVFFGMIAVLVKNIGAFPDVGGKLVEIFRYVVPIFIAGGVVSSTLLTKNRIQAIKEKSDLTSKLNDYRAALILKYALLEGPSFFALVCYLLTGDYYHLVFAGFIIIIFLINRPTIDKISNDLELNSGERATIES